MYYSVLSVHQVINISLYDVKSMLYRVHRFLVLFPFPAAGKERSGFGWLADPGQDSSVLVAGADEAQEVLSEVNKLE